MFSKPTVQLKPHRVQTLENGLKIYFIQDESLPLVNMQMLVRVGARHEPSGQEGVNSLAGILLETGTTTKSAVQVADALGALGTELSFSGGTDFSLISIDGLSTRAGELLDIYAEIVRSPSFRDQEIARQKSRLVGALKKKLDNPSVVASDAYDQFLFGGHPYGRDPRGTVESISKLQKSDVIRHYLSWYRPNNAVLAVTGRFDQNFEAQVVKAFADWPSRELKTVEFSPATQVASLEEKKITKAGLTQAQIRIGRVGISRKDPRFLSARLAVEILGGSFGSRLMQRVRDDLGLTYSIYASLDARQDPGAITISTFTKPESVDKTVQETLEVLRNYVKSGATEAELLAAKSQMIGQFPRAIETAERLAYNLLVLDFYGIPETYLTNFEVNVSKISLKEVNGMLGGLMDPSSLKILKLAP